MADGALRRSRRWNLRRRAQAVQLCDEMGRQRSAVARLRALMSASQERRDGLSRTPWVASNAAMRFRCAACCTRNSRSRCGRSRLPLPRTARPRPASTWIAGSLCGQDAKEPDSVQPVGFGAPGASGDQDAGWFDNMVDHVVRGQKSMQPKSVPPGLKAADDKRSRVIRRIQPVAQAGDESKQSCAVARFQTMKLSLVVSGYTIRDDPGGRAQFDSEIDDLMANIRRHASAPVPDVGLSSLAEAPAA